MKSLQNLQVSARSIKFFQDVKSVMHAENKALESLQLIKKKESCITLFSRGSLIISVPLIVGILLTCLNPDIMAIPEV